ncbi:MAG: phosphate ABC transporter permease subunit PstC [Chitinivibrionales bacterium]
MGQVRPIEIPVVRVKNKVSFHLPTGRHFEMPFKMVTRLSAFLVIGMMAAIFLLLTIESAPVFHKFGFAFITGSSWNPVSNKFGALASIVGTLVTSFIAVLFGVPLALGSAFFLNELCPFKVRPALTAMIELLAAIPSIIYGMWGLFVMAPVMSHVVQPVLIKYLGPLPFVGLLFQGPPFGIGVLTAGLILSVMVLPFIASVSLQAFASVPASLREAAYGTGANVWEICRKIIIPYTKTSVIGAIMLGLGRALGETMAVTFVIGNAHRLSASLLAPGTTISATLANEFAEAFGDTYIASLLALGLILFLITFAILSITRVLLLSTKRRLPV